MHTPRKPLRQIIVFAAIGLALLVLSFTFLVTDNPFAPQLVLVTAVFIFTASVYFALRHAGFGRMGRKQARQSPSV
jgi:FtsH-binding integral membrane protein